MSLQIHKIPCISTAHLTEEAAKQLTEQGDNNPWCPCASWGPGYFLFLDDLETNDEEAPQCLVDIRDWLRNLECQGTVDNSRWVRLDCDAARVEGLAAYDW